MVVRSHMKHIRLKPTECQPQLLDEWMMIDIGPELFLCCWKMTLMLTLMADQKSPFTFTFFNQVLNVAIKNPMQFLKVADGFDLPLCCVVNNSSKTASLLSDIRQIIDIKSTGNTV